MAAAAANGRAVQVNSTTRPNRQALNIVMRAYRRMVVALRSCCGCAGGEAVRQLRRQQLQTTSYASSFSSSPSTLHLATSLQTPPPTRSANGGAAVHSPNADKGSKGKGKAARRVDEPRFVQISKALTQVLRHKAVSLKLPIQSDGYVAVDKLLSCKMMDKFGCTRAELEQIVRESDKQRFTLLEADGMLFIRANQGHSIKQVQDDLLLERLQQGAADLPQHVVHGTFSRFWPAILRQGLRAGGNKGLKFRNHVHFAVGLPRSNGVISGMRESSEIVIYLDVDRALAEGLPLFRSANGVILSSGFNGIVPPQFFLRAVRLADGSQLELGDADSRGDPNDVVAEPGG
eukprot:TRINITY_DN11335_c0_g1_i1.p1 TRINITY_DN11335_c0_g1~~TRINITY_DN11335_c0_g1_i1.p1  ORF type:complete len:370 (+),score=60.49 TRINITY_DN11335_c0_g1_i1:73-1110(+)